jgi:hypothetical protein
MANGVRKRRTRKKAMRGQIVRTPLVALPFPSEHPWDHLLTEDQLRKLPWRDKQRHVFESLRRKVAILQEYARTPSGVPEGVKIPKSRKELREWLDPAQGLWSWSWAKLDNPDHLTNGELIEAFWTAIEDLESAAHTKRSVLESEIKQRDRIIAALKLQNTVLISEVVDLRKQVYGV